jgi:hypothetical protein
MNIAAVKELIDVETLKQSVANWKWVRSREQFPRGGYLIGRKFCIIVTTRVL